MNLPAALGLCSIAALLFGSISAVKRILEIQRAERALLPALEKNSWLLQKMRKFVSSSEDGQSSADRERDLLDIIKSLTELITDKLSLQEQDRRAVLSALRQPSLASRQAYIGKLVEAARQQPQAATATT